MCQMISNNVFDDKQTHTNTHRQTFLKYIEQKKMVKNEYKSPNYQKIMQNGDDAWTIRFQNGKMVYYNAPFVYIHHRHYMINEWEPIRHYMKNGPIGSNYKIHNLPNRKRKHQDKDESRYVSYIVPGRGSVGDSASRVHIGQWKV